MIKIKREKLKEGNIVLCKYSLFPNIIWTAHILKYIGENIVITDRNLQFTYDNIEPISITVRLLSEIGFKSKENIKHEHSFHHTTGFYINSEDLTNFYCQKETLVFLHDLQNKYFKMNKEMFELTEDQKIGWSKFRNGDPELIKKWEIDFPKKKLSENFI